MDRPGTSRQSIDKVEMYEVREHVPYQPEIVRAPTITSMDLESRKVYIESTWESAWIAICKLYNLLHHMQIAIVVFCLWLFALTNAPNGDITNLHLHIIFAGTGYQLFLVEAVLTLHKHNAWSFHLSEDAKKIVHGCLQLIGAMFVLAGTFMALSVTNMQIVSAHGICGIIAFGFTVISFITGIITLFSSKVKLMIKSGPIKIFHVSMGLFGVSMGLVSIIIGFQMDYYKSDQESLSIALSTFVALILAYVLVQPLFGLIRSTKKMG